MRSAAELESFLDGPKPADIGALEMAASYIQAGEEIFGKLDYRTRRRADAG